MAGRPIFLDVASDLHYEMPGGAPRIEWPADAGGLDLLLAGDVGRVTDGSFLRGVADAAARYRHVYAVLGNHEFYNSSGRAMDEVAAAAAAQAATLPNVTLLQRGAATTADGVRLLGCTLWSDTRGAADAVEAAMADYRLIWTRGAGKYGGSVRRATAADTSAAWAVDAAWLQGAIEATGTGTGTGHQY